MKTFALLIVSSILLAVVTCQTQGQAAGPQRQTQQRPLMNPFMSMMLMRTIDNFMPLLFMMNPAMMSGGMMGGGLFPLLAANTIF